MSEGTRAIFLTTSRPSTTLPNTTCLPFSHGVAVVVMKNCDPLVLGPALACGRDGGERTRSGSDLVEVGD